MKIIDLFCGIGGLSLGFEQAGFEVCAAVDMWADAVKTYNHNRKEKVAKVISVEDFNEKELSSIIATEKITGIIGGPPCQGFSTVGKREIDDPRNKMYLEFYKAVKLVNPDFFVIENVKGMLTLNKGAFVKDLLKRFGEDGLGYTISYQLLNAADYGVPQNRRRAVIIGKRDGKAPELPAPLDKTVTVWDAISDLAYLESGEGKEEQEYKNEPQSDYQKKLRRESSILHNHVVTKHSKLALERLALIPPNAGKEVLPKEHLTKSIYSGTWTRMRKEEISVTITTRFDTPSSGKFTHPFLDRAITVREAARIQSFPDNFVFIGNKGSQMKQVGNAVPPLLAGAIAEVIMKDIKEEKAHE